MDNFKGKEAIMIEYYQNDPEFRQWFMEKKEREYARACGVTLEEHRKNQRDADIIKYKELAKYTPEHNLRLIL